MLRLMMCETLISCTGSRPQVEHKFITRPDTLLAKQHIEKAFRNNKKRVGHRWRLDETYSVPGVQGKQGCLNEPRVYLKYTNEEAGVKLFASTPGCAGV